MNIIKCDLCTNKIEKNTGISIDYTFGYGTTFDQSTLNIDLCEKCLIILFKSHIQVYNHGI